MNVSALRLALIPGAVEALGRQISKTPGFGEALDQSLNKIKKLSQNSHWIDRLSRFDSSSSLIKAIKISRNIVFISTSAALIGSYAMWPTKEDNKKPARDFYIKFAVFVMIEAIWAISVISLSETTRALCKVINATKIA